MNRLRDWSHLQSMRWIVVDVEERNMFEAITLDPSIAIWVDELERTLKKTSHFFGDDFLDLTFSS